MHELGICEPLVAAVTNRAAGRRVTGIRIRIGSRHRVDIAAFEMAFALAAEGSPAEGAAVEVIEVPAMGQCDGCGAAGEWSNGFELCPACGSTEVSLRGGDELILESISVAAPEEVP